MGQFYVAVDKDIKKYKNRSRYRTDNCGAGQYIALSTKPNEMAAQSRQRVEIMPDFIAWLNDKEPIYIALVLGMHDDDPLITILET